MLTFFAATVRFILAASLAIGCFGADSASWNRRSAAAYLDGRADWWMTWPNAARDHGTFCISCHTAAPYALSRLSLRAALQESGPSAPERKLLDNVTKRVRMWADVEPFYKDGKSGPTKSAESRGTESVLNALILATYDAREGKLSDDAKSAFQNMWALQEKTGAWTWLDFHNKPWEAGDSQYYGAALAALAVGRAPESYRTGENVELLKGYLQRAFASQSPVNRMVVVWASAMLPGLLTPEQQRSTLEEVLGLQQADGGWSLTSLAGTWRRRDETPLETKSDGYATGLVALVLQQPGISSGRKQLKTALAWLIENQSKTEGRWLAYSMNKNRDLSSDVGRFMSDAATAYAVLALSQGK